MESILGGFVKEAVMKVTFPDNLQEKLNKLNDEEGIIVTQEDIMQAIAQQLVAKMVLKVEPILKAGIEDVKGINRAGIVVIGIVLKINGGRRQIYLLRAVSELSKVKTPKGAGWLLDIVDFMQKNGLEEASFIVLTKNTSKELIKTNNIHTWFLYTFSRGHAGNKMFPEILRYIARAKTKQDAEQTVQDIEENIGPILRIACEKKDELKQLLSEEALRLGKKATENPGPIYNAYEFIQESLIKMSTPKGYKDIEDYFNRVKEIKDLFIGLGLIRGALGGCSCTLNSMTGKMLDGGSAAEDLVVYEKIQQEMEKGEEKLKIRREDIEGSEALGNLFKKVGINKFVELAYLHTAAELKLILESIIKDGKVTDKDLPARAVSIWSRIFRDNNKLRWILGEGLKCKLPSEIIERKITEILKKIIKSLDNEIYVYKKYGFGDNGGNIVFYFVYSKKAYDIKSCDGKRQIGLTVSLNEGAEEGVTEIEIHEIQGVTPKKQSVRGAPDKQVISCEDIERSIKTGTIFQIKSEGRVAYKAATPIIWWHNMPKTLNMKEWEAYLAALKLQPYFSNIYLKLAGYVMKNKNYLTDYSFERFFFKSFVLLHHGNDDIKEKVCDSLTDIDILLDYNNESIIDNKLREIAGEISGIYEVSVKRGTTLGYFSRHPIKATGVNIVNGPKKFGYGWEQEWDAVSGNAVFEFKHAISLNKLYRQIFGIGARSYYLKSLVYGKCYDPEINACLENIHNIVFFGENLLRGGHMKEALLYFIDKHKGEKGLTVIANGKSISVKFDLPAIIEFLSDNRTVELTKQELEFIMNEGCNRIWLYKQLFDPQDIRSRFKKYERMIDILEQRARNKGRRFDIIIGISNFGEIPESIIKESKDGGETEYKLIAEFVKIEPKVFFTERQFEIMLGTLRGRAIGESKSEALKVPRQLGLVDEKFNTTPKFTEFITHLEEGKITTDYLWENGFSRWLDDYDIELLPNTPIKSQGEFDRLFAELQSIYTEAELEILRKIPEEGIPAKERTMRGLIAIFGSYRIINLLMELKSAKVTRDLFDDQPNEPLKLSSKGRALIENKNDGGKGERVFTVGMAFDSLVIVVTAVFIKD
ncbi:MAG: hypothetical protein KJ594_01115, partial [Candidatus Omnitrophica bacterium]|nr:hypothetical protein [Candidatus Omnitrophota bacterium]